KTIHPVQHPPVAWQQRTAVFNTPMTLQHTFEEIAQNRCETRGQYDGQQHEVISAHQPPHDQRQQKIEADTTQKAFPGFTGTDRWRQFALTPATTCKVATYICTCYDRYNQQHQQSSVVLGSDVDTTPPGGDDHKQVHLTAYSWMSTQDGAGTEPLHQHQSQRPPDTPDIQIVPDLL